MKTASTLRLALTALLIAAIFSFSAPSAGAASPAPHWSIISMPTPTNFVPGDTAHTYTYDVRAANVGAVATDGSSVTITDTLPAAVEVASIKLPMRFSSSNTELNFAPFFCTTEAGPPAKVTCTLPSGEFPPGSGDEHAVVVPEEEVRLVISVAVPPGTPVAQLTNQVKVEGGGSAPAEGSSQNQITSEENPQAAPSGFSFYQTEVNEANGESSQRASGHPYSFTTSFAINTKFGIPGNIAEFVPSGGDLKDIPVTLPPGFVGNPNVATKCTAQQFSTLHSVNLAPGVITSRNACPPSSQVGIARVQQVEGIAGLIPVPIYNLAPPAGEPAQFGFQVLGVPIYIDTEVRPENGYKIVAGVRNNTQAKRVTAASVTFWGTPADALHDPNRGECLSTVPLAVGFSICEEPAGLPAKPFLRLPTSCSSPLAITMSFNTWTNPVAFVSQTSGSPALAGCAQIPFGPTLQARPTTDVADSPTGLHADLHIPQPEDPEGLGEADLRKTVVNLPPGLVVNPSGANGLDSCSEAQVGYLGKRAGVDTFNNSAANCPDAARIGTAEVRTPLVDHPLLGSVYVATPHANPFDSLLAIYLAINDPASGVVVKLAGHVEADPHDGQLKTTFDETPQTPFEDFKLDFFGGPRAALRSPQTCGPKSTKSVLTPWSTPAGTGVSSTDNYSINRSPGGGACSSNPGGLPNSPAFRAGTRDPIAGAYSPLLVNISRDDGSQELSSLTFVLPPGLIGKPAGVPYCSDSALATASGKSGREEIAQPSCPAASELGTATVGAGAGPSPYYTTGHAYLAGPYNGAPLSMAIITPAAAGPYDLGTVVVRTALRIHPETAQVTAVSDPIPHILEGILLDVRSIAVKVDRPDFTLNPTNCEPLSFEGQWISVPGQSASLSNRFQVGECGRLRFKPKLHLRLRGGTKRAKYPQLRAVLQMPSKGANIARTSVALPHSEFLAQEHIRTICTRVQFAAKQCPRGSIYGRVKAISPLVDYPLEGLVYLRSSSHPLPDMVLALRGPAYQPIEIDAVGRIDSVRGGLRVTFDSVPDAPLTKLVLNMRGGKKSLLVNSRDICKHPGRAKAKFTAQNGRRAQLAPRLRSTSCKKKHKRSRGHKKR